MTKYNYVVKFKINGESNYRYNICFTIEAETNKEAIIKGEQKWNEQVHKRQRLQNALILKTTCRKVETKPRQAKRTPLQKALCVLNDYIY